MDYSIDYITHTIAALAESFLQFAVKLNGSYEQ